MRVQSAVVQQQQAGAVALAAGAEVDVKEDALSLPDFLRQMGVSIDFERLSYAWEVQPDWAVDQRTGQMRAIDPRTGRPLPRPIVGDHREAAGEEDQEDFVPVPLGWQQRQQRRQGLPRAASAYVPELPIAFVRGERSYQARGDFGSAEIVKNFQATARVMVVQATLTGARLAQRHLERSGRLGAVK